MKLGLIPVNVGVGSAEQIVAVARKAEDFVSNGRFMLGVGIGWLKEEFEALGAPFERRGARFDDYIQAMRKVWSEDVVEHESDFISWSGFKSYPLPVQKPHLPVIIGGTKGKAFERTAKYGDGWFAPTAGPDQLAPMLEELKKACNAVDRDPDTVEISAMWVEVGAGMDTLRRYEDLGVSRLIVPIFALGGGNPLGAIDKFAEEIISQL